MFLFLQPQYCTEETVGATCQGPGALKVVCTQGCMKEYDHIQMKGFYFITIPKKGSVMSFPGFEPQMPYRSVPDYMNWVLLEDLYLSYL